MAEALLTREFIRRLETLKVVSGRRFAGAGYAQREGVRRGMSLEFSDYRQYSPGDDLRYVDWNIYGRTEKPFIRTFVEEEDLFVYLLVDTSASMLEGRPDKLHWALRLAAALSYISLAGLDRVSVAAFDGHITKVLRPVRGKGAVFTILDVLEDLPRGGTTTNMAVALREHARLVKTPGVAIVLSDFLDERYEEGLKQLIHRRFKVHAIQILSPQELDPPLEGELLLTDVETGRTRPVTVEPSFVERYRATVGAFIDTVRETCRSRGATHTFVRTDGSVENVVLGDLRRSGVVG